jgi:Type II secretion system (T2SS), protein E, N-terminal domain
MWIRELADILDLDIVDRAKLAAWWSSAASPNNFDAIEALPEMSGRREFLQAKAQEMGVGFIDLDRISPDPAALASVPLDLVTGTQSIPVKKDRATLYVAISDVGAIEVTDVHRSETGYRIVPVLATRESIAKAISTYYDRDDKPC